MIKVFLSLPMHGYNTREVTEMLAKMENAVRKIYSSVNPDKLEFVTNYYFSPEKEIRHMRPYCLGEAIKKMADCYLVVFHPDYRQANGCWIEYEVCNRYHINAYILSEEDLI